MVDFWPKMRKNVNVDGNALHAISSIMDVDFDKNGWQDQE